jgi:quercetin 2,3-dioxygenase
LNLWDLELRRDGTLTAALPEGDTLALVVLRGTVLVNAAEVAREAQLVLLDRSGDEITIEANNDARILVLSGRPACG